MTKEELDFHFTYYVKFNAKDTRKSDDKTSFYPISIDGYVVSEDFKNQIYKLVEEKEKK